MIIQQSNWLTRARKAAGSKGPAQADLLEDINQMVMVDDLSDFRYDALGGVKRMIAPNNAGAVVAQQAFCTVFNPLGSGVVGFFDGITLAQTSGAACEFNVQVIAADVAFGQLTPYHLDQRFGFALPAVNDISSMICRNGTAVAPPGGNILRRFRMSGVAERSVDYDFKAVIVPGSGLLFLQALVNGSFTIDIKWSERPFESGEQSAG